MLIGRMVCLVVMIRVVLTVIVSRVELSSSYESGDSAFILAV